MRNDLPNNPITDIKILPEFDISENNSPINILLSHDYFSSDNDNGRKLLSDLLISIINCGKEIGQLYIIDSGVRTLDHESKYHDLIERLICLAGSVLVCSDSLNFYDVSVCIESERVHIASSEEIFSTILCSRNIIRI